MANIGEHFIYDNLVEKGDFLIEYYGKGNCAITIYH